MLFQTYGDRRNPAVLFFHAMGVTGASSEPIARYLQDRYFCILPTSTVYCEGQKYVSKLDEIRQVEDFLHRQGVERLVMVVASSIGADLAMAFLTGTKLPIGHVFFDGGQFAQIGKGMRHMMTPFLYLAIKSMYWSKGGTLKKILWCDDDSIKPYFIAAGKNLTYTLFRFVQTARRQRKHVRWAASYLSKTPWQDRHRSKKPQPVQGVPPPAISGILPPDEPRPPC